MFLWVKPMPRNRKAAVHFGRNWPPTNIVIARKRLECYDVGIPANDSSRNCELRRPSSAEFSASTDMRHREAGWKAQDQNEPIV